MALQSLKNLHGRVCLQTLRFRGLVHTGCIATCVPGQANGLRQSIGLRADSMRGALSETDTGLGIVERP